MFLATFMLEALDFQHLGPSIQNVVCTLQQPWSVLKSKMTALEALQGRLKNANWDTLEGSNWDTEIRLKDFQFRLATVHQGQFAHKEWQPCQFELLKRHLSHKLGKVKPVKSNPFKSTQNPNLVMRCFLYHKVANENATESPWHACLSASCPGSELLKAVAMRPIRLTAQQAKGGTLKSSFFN